MADVNRHDDTTPPAAQGSSAAETPWAGEWGGTEVQFGEQGNEAGLMVLPNRIAQVMKDTQGGIGDQNFYFNRSDDMLRDKYAFKQMVKEAVSEAMR